MRKRMEHLAEKVARVFPVWFTDVYTGGNIEHDGKYFLMWRTGDICRSWNTQAEAVEGLTEILENGYIETKNGCYIMKTED